METFFLKSVTIFKIKISTSLISGKIFVKKIYQIFIHMEKHHKFHSTCTCFKITLLLKLKKKIKVLPGFGNASNELNLFLNSLYSINLNELFVHDVDLPVIWL